MSNSFNCTSLNSIYEPSASSGGGGGGTVTSVAMTVPSFMSVAGSPITITGTFAITLVSQNQNLIFASPNGSAGSPTFRSLVEDDLIHTYNNSLVLNNGDNTKSVIFNTAVQTTIDNSGILIDINGIAGTQGIIVHANYGSSNTYTHLRKDGLYLYSSGYNGSFGVDSTSMVLTYGNSQITMERVGGNVIFNNSISLNLASSNTGDIYYRNSSGYFTRLGIGTSGQVLQVSGGLPTWATAGGGFAPPTTTVVTGTSQSATTNNVYVTNNASLVTVTLPTTAGVGDILNIIGLGAGGWKIAQNVGQNIIAGGVYSTTGTSGYISSNNQYDCVYMVCLVANTTWAVVNSSLGVTGLTLI